MNTKNLIGLALCAALAGCVTDTRPQWRNPYGAPPAVGFGPAVPRPYYSSASPQYSGTPGMYGQVQNGVVPYGPFSASLQSWGPFSGAFGWGGPTPGLSSGRGK